MEQPIHLAEYIIYCEECGLVGVDLVSLVAETCIRCGTIREKEED